MSISILMIAVRLGLTRIVSSAEAGIDALKDKGSEHKHDASAEANKQAATH